MHELTSIDIWYVWFSVSKHQLVGLFVYCESNCMLLGGVCACVRNKLMKYISLVVQVMQGASQSAVKQLLFNRAVASKGREVDQ